MDREQPTTDINLLRRIARGKGVRFLSLSTSAVAREAGCSATHVRRCLDGKATSASTAARIRAVLGITDDVIRNE